MSDDLLAGAIAARLRLLPEVQRLYPRRPPLAAVPGLSALVDAVASDQTVAFRTVDGVTVAEVSIGVAGGAGALGTALDAVKAVRDSLGVTPGLTAVRVRIASVD